MSQAIKVLLIEDMPFDADFAIRDMRKGGLEIETLRVDTRVDLEIALGQFSPDLILSDYSLPGFSGMDALQIAMQYRPNTPFIFVSGTIGEERAIEALKRGATDYVLKDNRGRLVPAIRRALNEKEERKARQRIEDELQISEARFRSIAEATEEWIWEMDAQGIYTYCNPAVTTILAYTPDELIGSNALSYIKEDHQDTIFQHYQRALAEKQGWRNQLWRWRRKDGGLRWLESNGLPLLDQLGKVTGYRGANRDVTERIQQQQKIDRLSRIHSVLSGINSTIVRLRDREELFREVCRVAVIHGKFVMAWIGLSQPGTARNIPVVWYGADQGYLDEMTLAGENENAPIQIHDQVFLGKKAVISNRIETDARIQNKSEALKRGYRSMAALPLLVDGNVIGVMVLYGGESGFFNDDEVRLLKGLAADISFGLDHIAQLERLDYVSHFDILTGLANRQLFSEKLTETIKTAQAEKQNLALVVIDLQQFRNINETLGRAAGDYLLKEFALRLLKIFGEPSAPARLSGDRFAVLMTGLTSAALALHMENHILNELAVPFEIEGMELRSVAKIGIVLFPDDGETAEVLLANAEAALQRAKDTTDTYVFYSREINERVGHRLRLESRLRKAVEKKQFLLHYQTKVNLVTKKIQGLEALIRWQDPDYGLISPLEFIPLLEESGLIVEVGRWVIEQVVNDMREWDALGLEVPRVAVNVSQVQLHKKNFVAMVLATLGLADHLEQEMHFDKTESIIPDSRLTDLEVSHCGPVCVDLEITESFIAQDPGTNLSKLRQLRLAGLHIYMDDFGTGYSSLSQITQLPLDALKIDRAFISSMTQKTEHMAIVSNIINLARTLKITVIAEGVETEEQAELLKALGCDQAQGYLFNRPLPADEVAKLLGPAPGIA